MMYKTKKERVSRALKKALRNTDCDLDEKGEALFDLLCDILSEKVKESFFDDLVERSQKVEEKK